MADKLKKQKTSALNKSKTSIKGRKDTIKEEEEYDDEEDSSSESEESEY